MSFPSREEYERFLYLLPSVYPQIESSSLHLYPNSPLTCFVRGSIWFRNGLELRVLKYLDFSDGELLEYHYAVFRKQQCIRWYDAQPHPEIVELAETFPHHYHEFPDIRRNRRPALGISFQSPNLPTLISHCLSF